MSRRQRRVTGAALLAMAGLLWACDPAPPAPASSADAASAAAVGPGASPALASGPSGPPSVNPEGMSTVVKDEQGRATRLAYGGGGISASDTSVPFYPGARRDEAFGMRALTPVGSLATVKLVSRDAPEAVLEFYREQLKALWGGERNYSEGPGEEGRGLKLKAESLTGDRLIEVSIFQPGRDTEIVIQSQFFNAPAEVSSTAR